MNFNFFKKKLNNKVELEKAEAEGLITKEEFLELKVKRAEKELKDYRNSKNFKKGVSK
ncbi:unnamed protein product [marine sediment metagenome]|uniref:SHOCT domain-containing protein n=1 Tax=marine sediment metagenome TaxID=412755 RepID=X1MMN5_9ZZZZ